MLADEYQLNRTPSEFLPVGALDTQALPCLSRDAVLNVIEDGLAEFASRKELRKIQNEKGITNRLCKILGCHKLLNFFHEGMQDESDGTSPSVDMEAVATTSTVFEARLYAKEQTLMAIEAKRLPAPPPKTREREYLIGGDKQCGGLERFKLGIHGRDAAALTLLGYIQKHDFQSWHNTINAWVDFLVKNGQPKAFWESDEKLELLSEQTVTARYRSRNKRHHDGKTDTIEVAHLWVLLN